MTSINQGNSSGIFHRSISLPLGTRLNFPHIRTTVAAMSSAQSEPGVVGPSGAGTAGRNAAELWLQNVQGEIPSLLREIRPLHAMVQQNHMNSLASFFGRSPNSPPPNLNQAVFTSNSAAGPSSTPVISNMQQNTTGLNDDTIINFARETRHGQPDMFDAPNGVHVAQDGPLLDNIQPDPETEATATAENANNGNGASNATTVQNSITEVLARYPEAAKVLKVCGKLIPFLLIVVLKFLFDYRVGILISIGLQIAFAHSNAVTKRQACNQSKRHLIPLFGVMLNSICVILFTVFMFSDDSLYLTVFMMPPVVDVTAFTNLIWVVVVSDFIIKLLTILTKDAIILMPEKLLPYTRRGRVYLFIERTSQVWRSCAPVQPWLVHIGNAYNGMSYLFGLFLLFVYASLKIALSADSIKDWYSASRKLFQHSEFGIKPSVQQLSDADYICSICQDEFKQPVSLSCKHVFCEGCVSTWLDREKTCPMCRAQVSDDASWRDGSTSSFICLF